MKKQAIVHHLNILSNNIMINAVNAGGWDSDPLFRLHLDLTVGMGDDFVARAREAWDAGHFKAVALVEIDTDKSGFLEIAWERTNSIHSHWSENDGVQEIGKDSRSSAVGDIVEVDGILFVVAGSGFKTLGDR